MSIFLGNFFVELPKLRFEHINMSFVCLQRMFLVKLNSIILGKTIEYTNVNSKSKDMKFIYLENPFAKDEYKTLKLGLNWIEVDPPTF